MTDGLKFLKYALLLQENDPLEFCVCPLPIPSNIGIPFFPCELPNNFTLFQSNENHNQKGMKIMDLEEIESYRLQRAICCPSARPFEITSRDFYNNIPISGERLFSIPFLKDNTLTVKYDGQYAGRVVQEKSCQFAQGIFHSLEIYDENDQHLYKIQANLKQKGLLCFLPFQQCERITYEILEEKEQVGSIQHIFYGFDNEFCSKADQYGISFPDDCEERHKALLIMATIFIDYLWFENV